MRVVVSAIAKQSDAEFQRTVCMSTVLDACLLVGFEFLT